MSNLDRPNKRRRRAQRPMVERFFNLSLLALIAAQRSRRAKMSAEGASFPSRSRGMLPLKILKFKVPEIAGNAFNVNPWPLAPGAESLRGAIMKLL